MKLLRDKVPKKLQDEINSAFPDEFVPPLSRWQRWGKPVVVGVLCLIVGLWMLASIEGRIDGLVESNETLAESVNGDDSRLADENAELERQLSLAPSPGALEKIEDAYLEQLMENQRLNTSHTEALRELNNQLKAEQDAHAETQQLLEAETSRADEAEKEVTGLKTDLADERAAILAAVSNAVNSSDRLLLAEHFIGVEWVIERRWLGGLNDEAHEFRGDALSIYGVGEANGYAYWSANDTIRVPVGMPQLKFDDFIVDQLVLSPNYGAIADIGHIIGDETDQRPLFVEAKRRLHEIACSDVQSLKRFMNDTLVAAQAAAGEHDVLLRWRDVSGLYHNHEDVTDQMLLDSACT